MVRILLSTMLGERRWKQADLARATGIRAETINQLYHEIAVSIKIEHIDKICKALECEITDLIVHTPDDAICTKYKTGKKKHSEK